jgi:hypothetical protein
MVWQAILPFGKIRLMILEMIFGEKDVFIPNTLIHPSDSTKGVAMKAAALMPLAESHFVEGAGQFCASRKKQ